MKLLGVVKFYRGSKSEKEGAFPLADLDGGAGGAVFTSGIGPGVGGRAFKSGGSKSARTPASESAASLCRVVTGGFATRIDRTLVRNPNKGNSLI